MIISPGRYGRGEHIFLETTTQRISWNTSLSASATLQQKTFTVSPGKFHPNSLFWLPDIQPKMMVDVFPAGDMLVELGPRPSENGFMEPKYLAEEVIIHPNHHLTR